jgi:hypothetical protein
MLPISGTMLSWWVLAKVFASGCTAMTGVEAVSNGVMAFREPTQKNAKRTLTIIILLLMVFLAGIALLCRAYAIGATDPGAAGYQSILSQLTAAVLGRTAIYYVTIGSILVVVTLSANTSFADFPRLTRAIAQRDYLPHVFTVRGRRLLYSHGIYALVGFTAVLLIVSGGITDWLIPLFAIGAFLAFTLSQAGMVMHWKREGGAGATRRMVVNGVGAVADRGAGGEIHGGRVDYGAPDSRIDDFDDCRQTPLRRRGAGTRMPWPHANQEPERAADHYSDGSLEPDERKGAALRHEAERRGAGGPRGCRGVLRRGQKDVGAQRSRAFQGRRQGCAPPGADRIALPLYPGAAGRLHPEG